MPAQAIRFSIGRRDEGGAHPQDVVLEVSACRVSTSSTMLDRLAWRARRPRSAIRQFARSRTAKLEDRSSPGADLREDQRPSATPSQSPLESGRPDRVEGHALRPSRSSRDPRSESRSRAERGDAGRLPRGGVRSVDRERALEEVAARLPHGLAPIERDQPAARRGASDVVELLSPACVWPAEPRRATPCVARRPRHRTVSKREARRRAASSRSKRRLESPGCWIARSGGSTARRVVASRLWSSVLIRYVPAMARTPASSSARLASRSSTRWMPNSCEVLGRLGDRLASARDQIERTVRSDEDEWRRRPVDRAARGRRRRPSRRRDSRRAARRRS